MSRLVHLAVGTRRLILLLGVIAAVVLLQGGSGASPPTLRSGPATFVITSRIHQAPPGGDLTRGCSGPTATLTPGVSRCLVLRVDSSVDRDIQVESLSITLDTSQHDPDQCTSQLVLPQFRGALIVPANGSAHTPGLPVLLRNTNTDQDDCQGRVFHFLLTGTAVAAPIPEDPADPAEPDGQDAPSALPDTGSSFSPLRVTVLGTTAGLLVALGLVLLRIGGRRRADEAS